MRDRAPWSTSLAALAAFALAWATPMGSARAEAEDAEEVVVDRVLVVLGSVGAQADELRIITAFELEVEARLVLAERSRSLETAMISLDDRFTNSILEGIINQFLLVDEATRLQLIDPTEAQLAAERDELEARLGGPGMLARFCDITGAPMELVDWIIRRRFIAEEFVLQNIQLAFSVTENDLVEVYERGDHPFGDRPIEEIRGQLEAFVLARRQRQRLEEWFDEARRRSRIRRIDP